MDLLSGRSGANLMHHLARVLRVATPLAVAILIGLWVNALSTKLQGGNDLFKAIRQLGFQNVWLCLGLGCVVGSEFAHEKLDQRRAAELADYAGGLLDQERRLAHLLLRSFAEQIGRSLGTACNARYFNAIDEDGEVRLYQDRSLVYEAVPMPAEYGFTSVSVTDRSFVSARAYQHRAPIFENLKSSHTERYSELVRPNVDPEQKWVLACPVLQIDPRDDIHRRERPPFGVAVFYSTERVPLRYRRRNRIRRALHDAQLVSEHLSHIMALQWSIPRKGGSDV